MREREMVEGGGALAQDLVSIYMGVWVGVMSVNLFFPSWKKNPVINKKMLKKY
jgi:hypothetical protein